MATLNFRIWHSRDRIKARILIPFSVLLLSVVGGFLTTAYLSKQSDRATELNNSVNAVERFFHQRLENDSNQLRATLAAIVNSGEFRDAFQKRDRQLLLRRAKPLFEVLRHDHRISHFYFNDTEKVNFLRVHQPDRHGDTIERVTMLRAFYSGETASGLELGPLGTFTLRVVMPWEIGGKIVGYVELGEEIDHIGEDIHRILNVDLLVTVYKKLLDPKAWTEGMEMLGHANDWKQFPTTVVVGSTINTIPPPVAELLSSDRHPYREVLQLDENEKSYFVAFMPLRNVVGTEVGDFIVLRDMSGVQAAFWSSIRWTASVSVLVGIGVFFVFYLILDRVEQDYRRQRDVEMQLDRVNEKHQKMLQIEKLSAMGLMIGEIAHQLNNPLVGVINMAQLAERNADNPSRLLELLGRIIKAGKDCHAFVTRMLEFNKISCFDRKPTDMKKLIEDTILLYRQSDGAHHHIETDLPDSPVVIDVDPVLVGHALFNLLSNAGEASPSNASILVGMVSEFEKRNENPGWKLSVRDHGPGVSKENLNKIFTPFFTTRSHGTGLGLPVVQHVIILHEGELFAGNAPDGGAEFAMWFPATP